MQVNKDALESILRDLVRVCIDVFGREGIEAVIQLGSSVKGGAIPGYSDVDLHVYLTSACFDDRGQIPESQVFAFQAGFASLPWHNTGYGYPQLHFLDARRLPEGWVGPSGGYRELLGKLPIPEPSAEELRAASLRYIRDELPRRIAGELHTFIDATNESLPRRLRFLGTEVAPAIVSLAAAEAADPKTVWALSKLEVLTILEERYSGELGPGLARQFYDSVRSLYGGKWDNELARITFRAGIEFLRWVVSKDDGGG